MTDASSGSGWFSVPAQHVVEDNLDLFACPRCAALVPGREGRDRHQEWHEAQTRHAGEVDA